jgi:hypothetical protein
MGRVTIKALLVGGGECSHFRNMGEVSWYKSPKMSPQGVGHGMGCG